MVAAQNLITIFFTDEIRCLSSIYPTICVSVCFFLSHCLPPSLFPPHPYSSITDITLHLQSNTATAMLVCLFTCLSAYLSVCLPVCLSVCLSVCLFNISLLSLFPPHSYSNSCQIALSSAHTAPSENYINYYACLSVYLSVCSSPCSLPILSLLALSFYIIINQIAKPSTAQCTLRALYPLLYLFVCLV